MVKVWVIDHHITLQNDRSNRNEMTTDTEINIWNQKASWACWCQYATFWEEWNRKERTSLPIWTTQWIQGPSEQVTWPCFKINKRLSLSCSVNHCCILQSSQLGKVDDCFSSPDRFLSFLSLKKNTHSIWSFGVCTILIS